MKQTNITYANLGSGIVNRPSVTIVYDGSINKIGQTTYSYDEGAVTATTGTPQHQSVGPGAARGNLTTISYWIKGTTTLTKAYTYYDTGNVNTASDVNGATTTYAYGSGSCGNSFVTSVSEPLTLTRSIAWNCAGGVQISATDENGHTVSSSYTNPYYWRTDSVQDAASSVTNFTYSGSTQVESAMTFATSASDSLTTVDGLGRSHLSQVRQSPSSSIFDTIETDYDSAGRQSRITLPYAGTSGQTSSTAPAKTITYDALGRTTRVTNADGGNVTTSYSQNDAYRSFGPAPPGENPKRTQLEYDARGHLTSVCEITTLTGSGTCGQSNPATGYWTKYNYDQLGDLINVTQNAQSSSVQTRTYTYDGIARMTSETNPESGTTTYVYDSDSTCGTYSGDLVKKVDAVGNTSCYAYDTLHRLISITYSGPYAANTPNRYYRYDSATVNGTVMANAKSRMAESYTATCSTCTKLTDLGFSYTPLGQLGDVYESTPHSGTYYHVTSTYWPNGRLHQLSNLTGLPTLTYGVDGEGRIYSVSASSGQNPLVSTIYNTASEPTQVSLGSSDSDAFTYDPNTNRMTKYQFNVNGQAVVGQLTWNSIGTLRSLAITDPFYSAGNQNCTYAHDDLSRISSANCGAIWSQTYLYDAFGNITKSGTTSFQPTYSYASNRMTQIGSSTPTYDANGNVTNDFMHAYTWDANGRPITVDGVALTYDGLGRMVEQSRNGTYSQIVYSPKGVKFAVMNGASLLRGFVPLAGGAHAIYNSGGLAYYRHADWIGSSRFASTPARVMYSDVAFSPFGESYAQSGTVDLSFTGMNQDTVSNLYDFQAREYGIQGRWPSPDPAGATSMNLKDPQTLDRYTYVANRPLSSIDPTGMMTREPPQAAGGELLDGYIGSFGDVAVAMEIDLVPIIDPQDSSGQTAAGMAAWNEMMSHQDLTLACYLDSQPNHVESLWSMVIDNSYFPGADNGDYGIFTANSYVLVDQHGAVFTGVAEPDELLTVTRTVAGDGWSNSRTDVVASSVGPTNYPGTDRTTDPSTGQFIDAPVGGYASAQTYAEAPITLTITIKQDLSVTWNGNPYTMGTNTWTITSNAPGTGTIVGTGLVNVNLSRP